MNVTAAPAPTSQAVRPAFRIFRARDAVDVGNEVMPMEGMNEVDLSGIAKAVGAGVQEGSIVRLLFADPVSGMSLAYAWFKPNYVLPRHSHDADCAYYVISGEARLGTETLKAGDGFFVPSGHMYQYVAGPEGVEVMEFRTAASFNMLFSGNKEAFWDRMAKVSADNLEGWRAMDAPVAVRRFNGAEA